MGFLHRVADDIRALKDLLKRYDFGRDGRSIYKELLQNADDAKASAVQFHLLAKGFGQDEVSNPLLRVPAFVTVNNGQFRSVDAENMRYRTGTSKSLEVGAVGRFGLGQKSVFHLCEAWFCVGSSALEGITACNMDPWEHQEKGDADFPLWPEFNANDQDVIRRCMAPFLEGEDWFILWLPLRRREHRRKRSGVISRSSDDWPKTFLVWTLSGVSFPKWGICGDCRSINTKAPARSSPPSRLARQNRPPPCPDHTTGQRWPGRSLAR
jgi:hypothetical protein